MLYFGLTEKKLKLFKSQVNCLVENHSNFCNKYCILNFVGPQSMHKKQHDIIIHLTYRMSENILLTLVKI